MNHDCSHISIVCDVCQEFLRFNVIQRICVSLVMIRLGLVQVAVDDDVSWWKLTMREELWNAGCTRWCFEFVNCFFRVKNFFYTFAWWRFLSLVFFELDAAYSHMGGRRSLSILSSKLEMKRWRFLGLILESGPSCVEFYAVGDR